METNVGLFSLFQRFETKPLTENLFSWTWPLDGMFKKIGLAAIDASKIQLQIDCNRLFEHTVQCTISD